MTISKYLVRYLILVVLISSCKNDNGPLPKDSVSYVEFKIHTQDQSGGRIAVNSDPQTILVTIKDAGDNVIYSLRELKLITFGGEFVSEPLAISPGNYFVTEFLVLDEFGDAIYAAPIQGSVNALLVDNPLPNEFTVTSAVTTEVIIDVLKVDDTDQPADFGYASIKFPVTETFLFEMAVFIISEPENVPEPTTANLIVTIDGTERVNRSLSSGNNLIKINEMDMASYEVTVTKDDYHNSVQTFTLSELKAHEPGSPSGPLHIILDKNVIPGWHQVTASAQWGNRGAQTMLEYDSKIWVIGGSTDTGGLQNDVWSSENGVDWIEVTPSAEWEARSSHASVVYDGKMWITGGSADGGVRLNDVWFSTDGQNWSQAIAVAQWPIRREHSFVTFNQKMWILGGQSGAGNPGEYLKDVWSSSDGINWNDETVDAPWSISSGHSSIVYDNKIWLIGGGHGLNLNDHVWSSDNGVNWVEESASTPMGNRAFHTSVTYRNKMWFIAGWDGAVLIDDVWTSENGFEWTATSVSIPWQPKRYHSSVVFDDKIWLVGSGSDIWYYQE